jgi:hypothetical protein
MSGFRLILSAGVCSIALSGCIPAAAGLALTAANLVTGGGGGNNANGFRNPIDRQSTGQAVKQALSQLNDRVDPACQAMLDEHQKARAAAPDAAKPADGPEAGQAEGETAPKEGARDLLAKVKAQAESQPQPQGADAVRPAEAASVAENAEPKQGEAKLVKTALAPAQTAAPGQCEHRLVCLPGTPKPTLMLMCPGKGTVAKDGKTAAPDGTLDQPKGEAPPSAVAAGAPAEVRPQETAAAEPAPAVTPEPVRASVPAGPAQAPAPEGGVADWNWAYDPSKRL